MLKVNKNYNLADITDVYIEEMGWTAVTPGTLTVSADGDVISFVDDEKDQVNFMATRLIASTCPPLTVEDE